MKRMSDYWKERAANSQNKLAKKSAKTIEKQMAKYYEKAMKNTIADFENVYNKLLTTMADGIEPTPADLYKLETYWKMQGQLRGELLKLGKKKIAALSKAFELHFFEVYYSIELEGMRAFSTIDNEMVEQLINHIWVADGKSWSQRIWEDTDKLAEALNETLVDCVINGKPTAYLRDALMERFNVSYSAADSLARTELAHIQTQAAQKRYENYGIQQMEVWADKDERRCEVCGELHMKRYPINAVPPIPAHPRCRCCIIPVVD
jgi:SPP1 gp7 family putative phage head morphogenesis protein